jgi:hypothetical protein
MVLYQNTLAGVNETMSKDGLTLGEYLDHLRKQRAGLDDLISKIESTRLDAPPLSAAGAHPQRKPQGPYSGVTIINAAIAFLRSVGKTQGTREILNAIREGGLKTASKSPYRTLYSTLNRRMENKGDVIKINGKWGLKAWE